MSLLGPTVLPVAAAGGAMMAVAAAGADSLLIPLFSLDFDFRLAVAAVSVPHFAAGALRALQLRKRIHWRLFVPFAVMSMLFTLAGALLQSRFSSSLITHVFAGLLVVSGVLGLTGLLEREHRGKAAAWVAGGAAGFFGGLCGEQGGLRAAGLMGFGLPKEAFVATGAAIGVAGDLVRIPIYAARQWNDLYDAWLPMAGAVAGVVVGIFIGRWLLRRLSQEHFNKVVSAVIVLVGVLLFLRHA